MKGKKGEWWRGAEKGEENETKKLRESVKMTGNERPK